MKKLLAVLLVSGISLLVNLLLSLIMGLGGYILGGSFWGISICSFAGIYIIGTLWNSFELFKATQYAKELDMAQKIVDAHQEINIGCATCNAINTTRILLNKDNDFVCIKCGATNSILMNFTTAIKTTPITPQQESLIRNTIATIAEGKK